MVDKNGKIMDIGEAVEELVKANKPDTAVAMIKEYGPAIRGESLSNFFEQANDRQLSIVRQAVDSRLEISRHDILHSFAIAAQKGHSSKLRYFLERYRGIVADEIEDALSLAALSGHGEIVNALLQERDDLNDEEINRLVPDLAYGGLVSILRRLFKKVAITLETAREALAQASVSGRAAVIQFLLEKIKYSPEEIAEAFKLAACVGHVHILKLLLERYPDVITAEEAGFALAVAADQGHFDVVRLILKEKGGVISVDDAENALDYARSNHFPVIANYIETHFQWVAYPGFPGPAPTCLLL